LEGVRSLLAQMPTSHFANLRYLIKFLSYLTSFAHKTRMSAKNYALVIAPNILSDGRTETTNSMLGAQLVEALILNADALFPGGASSAPHLHTFACFARRGLLVGPHQAAHQRDGRLLVGAALQHSARHARRGGTESDADDELASEGEVRCATSSTTL